MIKTSYTLLFFSHSNCRFCQTLLNLDTKHILNQPVKTHVRGTAGYHEFWQNWTGKGSLLSSRRLLFKWPMQCSWMFSRWENEQATSLFIPSHTAVIILSAVNVRQRRGRHNKNSGREALRPSLGAKPVILHLK